MSCTLMAGLPGLGCCKQDLGCVGVALGAVLYGFYPNQFLAQNFNTVLERWRTVTVRYNIDVDACSADDTYVCTMNPWTNEIACSGPTEVTAASQVTLDGVTGSDYNACRFGAGGGGLSNGPYVNTKTTRRRPTLAFNGVEFVEVGFVEAELSDPIDEFSQWVMDLYSTLESAAFPTQRCRWKQLVVNDGVITTNPEFVKATPCFPAPGPAGEILPFNAGALGRANGAQQSVLLNPWWHGGKLGVNPHSVEVRLQKINCRAKRKGCTTAWLLPIEQAAAQLLECKAQLGTPAQNAAQGLTLMPHRNGIFGQWKESNSYIHWSDNYLQDIPPAHGLEVQNCCGQNDNPAP